MPRRAPPSGSGGRGFGRAVQKTCGQNQNLHGHVGITPSRAVDGNRAGGDGAPVSTTAAARQPARDRRTRLRREIAWRLAAESWILPLRREDRPRPRGEPRIPPQATAARPACPRCRGAGGRRAAAGRARSRHAIGCVTLGTVRPATCRRNARGRDCSVRATTRNSGACRDRPPAPGRAGHRAAPALSGVQRGKNAAQSELRFRGEAAPAASSAAAGTTAPLLKPRAPRPSALREPAPGAGDRAVPGKGLFGRHGNLAVSWVITLAGLPVAIPPGFCPAPTFAAERRPGGWPWGRIREKRWSRRGNSRFSIPESG